jgi:hypothetical protein
MRVTFGSLAYMDVKAWNENWKHKAFKLIVGKGIYPYQCTDHFIEISR